MGGRAASCSRRELFVSDLAGFRRLSDSSCSRDYVPANPSDFLPDFWEKIMTRYLRDCPIHRVLEIMFLTGVCRTQVRTRQCRFFWPKVLGWTGVQYVASFMDESSFLHSGAVIMVEGFKKYGWTWKIRDGNTRGAKSWRDDLDSWYRDKICGTTLPVTTEEKSVGRN